MNLILDGLVGALRLLAFALALAAAAVALLALGGYADARLDVLTHAAPVTLAAGALALALRLASPAPGGRLTLALAGVAIVVSFVLMAPDLWAAARRRTSPPGEETLKLVQFNLWGRNHDPKGAAAWILHEDPDVVMLEETSDKARLVPLALRQRYPHQVTCAQPYPCPAMVLSKATPTAFGGLAAPGEPTRLTGAWMTFGSGPGAFTVVGVHFARPYPPGQQAAQSARLARFLDRFDKSALVVAGDFNSTPWSFALRRQDARFALERRTRALFTWPATHFSRWQLVSPLPFLAIDQVYAGAAWRTVQVRRGPRLGSDHFPVVVILTRDRTPRGPPP